MSEDALDQALARAYAQLEAAGGEMARLPRPVQVLLVVESAQGVIENGGFEYFFEADWPGRPDYGFFSEAFRVIGAREAALRIDQAAAMFPDSAPHQDAEARKAFMEALPENHGFHLLSDEACKDESVWEALGAYVRAHIGHFR